MVNVLVHEKSDDNILSSLVTGSETRQAFSVLYPDILTYDYKTSSIFIKHMWTRYIKTSLSKQLDVRIFRSLLSVLFYRERILPLYVKASFNHIPNIDFDFVAYCEEFGPVILSAKTSLRERYKQADLEGMMLRHVHRAAKSFLITLDAKDAKTVNLKIQNDLALGLDKVVVATAPEFDQLIKTLKAFTYIEPPIVQVLTSKRVIV